MNNIKFTIDSEHANKRLDVAIVENMENYTRSRVQQLIAEGCVCCNSKKVLKSCKLNVGDEIEINIPEIKQLELEPQNIPIEIIYEDNDILIVNKEKGMVVHPAIGNPDGTLVNALMYHCGESLSGINGEHRPGIVHRIDKDTSGLLMVAKNDISHNFLSEKLASHDIKREYHAIVHGSIKHDDGTVDEPIGRHTIERKKMSINSKSGKNAVTHYWVLERFNGFSYIKCQLETGRTHQIRVHLASIGHPIAGDLIYGPKRAVTELKGQCLHAKVLGFTHPTTGEEMLFDSNLPDLFTNYLEKLRRKG